MTYKYNLVYETTNLINGKIYIGLHSTDNLNDGYIGSGKLLKQAIKKYGKENFKRRILLISDSRLEVRKLEAKLVNTEFIKRKDTYNLIEGGGGVGDQRGSKNHRFGKVGTGAKRVKATHKSGRVIEADSIQDLSKKINIARGNIRNLINKQIQGRLGWSVCYCKDIV